MNAVNVILTITGNKKATAVLHQTNTDDDYHHYYSLLKTPPQRRGLYATAMSICLSVCCQWPLPQMFHMFPSCSKTPIP